MLTTGVECLENNGVNKWLSDNTKVTVTTPETSEWIQNEWLPRAIRAGWKYYALVESESKLGKMHIQQFIDSFLEVGITVNLFSDPEEAKKWLIDN